MLSVKVRLCEDGTGYGKPIPWSEEEEEDSKTGSDIENMLQSRDPRKIPDTKPHFFLLREFSEL